MSASGTRATAQFDEPVASVAGLSSEEARRRLAADGPNLLPGAERRSTLAIAFEVLREPMFMLLVAAAAIYLLLGDVREALVLAASIVVVAIITVIQERKSERALEALRDLSSPRALVIRDGAVQRIVGADVARGDLLLLAEGDRVPADARLAAANELLVDESLLTGESLPVEKQAPMPVFSGTLVLKGQGRAEVTATGVRTEFGRIGLSLGALDTEKTMLQRETAGARDSLTQALGAPVETYSCPFGRTSARVRDALRDAGFRAAVRMGGHRSLDPYDWPVRAVYATDREAALLRKLRDDPLERARLWAINRGATLTGVLQVLRGRR